MEKPADFNQLETQKKELVLIPKTESYVKYMLQLLLKIPRTEKYSIGTEYKQSMYKMIEHILYLSKIDISERFEMVNKIDADLSVQRILLRIMRDEKWIDEHKFKVAIDLIAENGKIIGGLIKYYGKNYKK